MEVLRAAILANVAAGVVRALTVAMTLSAQVCKR